MVFGGPSVAVPSWGKTTHNKTNTTSRISPAVDRGFLARCCVALVCRSLALCWFLFWLYIMPNPPRSTKNSLSTGLCSEKLPVLSYAPIVVSKASSGPVAPLAVDSITEAVVCVLRNTLPTIISVLPTFRLGCRQVRLLCLLLFLLSILCQPSLTQTWPALAAPSPLSSRVSVQCQVSVPAKLKLFCIRAHIQESFHCWSWACSNPS